MSQRASLIPPLLLSVLVVAGCDDAGGTRPARPARTPSTAHTKLGPAAGTRAAAGTEPVRVVETRTPMGTYMAITVYAPTEEAGKQAIAAAFARVEDAENVLSTYRPESDIVKLNRAAGGPAVPVRPLLLAVLRRSTEASAETGGAFDITVGPLVSLWKRNWRRGQLPTDEEIAETRERVGSRNVEIADGKVRLAKPRMRLDVSAIAKGYIVGLAVGALREAGIQAALVDAGGDIYALGSPPGRDGWTIGVRDPGRPAEVELLAGKLRLRDCAVATSGDYEQYLEIQGRRYSHIIDPRTGRPVEHMASVTVLAPDATTADAYATAISVLGPQAGVAFAEQRQGIETMILYREGDQLRTVRSGGFARFELRETEKP